MPQTPPATPTEPGFLPLTAVAQATAPAPERRACPVPTAEAPQPSLGDAAQAAAQLRDYLNQGGDPRQLAQTSPALHLARPDLDDDGWVDLAFVVQDAESASIVTPGTMLAFRCQGESYQLAYTAPDRPNFSAPTIHSEEDLNGDGGDELLLSRRSCGAHTCTAEVQVLSWRQGTLMNILAGATDDLPSPEVQVLPADDGRSARVAVTATGVNSVGAGPFRQLTRIWTWDAEADRYQVDGEEQQAPQFRIHALHDADRAAREGRYQEALTGYQRVIDDQGLQDWMEPEREQAILAAYARYRVVVVQARQGQFGAAEAELQNLRGAVGEGPGSPYLDLAEAYWAELQATGEIDAACRVARQYAAAHSAQILDPLYFGYSNPTYGAEDMCALAQE